MPIKQNLLGMGKSLRLGAMDYLIGFGVTGQPLLRRSTNPPRVWVLYRDEEGKKKKRRFGSPSCAVVFAKEIRGLSVVVINDGKTKQLIKYARGFFVKKKTINLEFEKK